MNQLMPVHEITNRRRRLADALRHADLDACMVSGVTNTYYYTGSSQNGMLFVYADGSHAWLVRKSLERATLESPESNIHPMPSLRQLTAFMSENGLPVPGKLGFEADILPVQLFERYKRSMEGVTFTDASVILRSVRTVKSDFELGCIREAGKQVTAVMDGLSQVIQPGVREIDVAAEAERIARKCGHQGLIRMRAFNAELFYGVVCSGPSANAPTSFDGPSGSEGLYPSAIHPAGDRQVEASKPLLVDFMGAYMGYLCDVTRVFFPGSPDEAVTRNHQKCLDVQGFIAENLRPGVVPGQLYEEALAFAASIGLQHNFMGYQRNQVRFLGHGVGLEVDEWPVIAPRFEQPLESGQVIAVEPKVYLPDVGGVGIENTFVVTGEGGVRMCEAADHIRIVKGWD